jgi:hypothetical protein
MIQRFTALHRILAWLLLPICFRTALLAQKPSAIRVTHVLGYESVPNNTSGSLTVQPAGLEFQGGPGQPAHIPLDAIKNVSLGEEDKQVGGVPMALGRAAAPFGSGRVIGLFSHKKYDTLTVEYVDSNGGFHGAIFRLAKGQGQALKNQMAPQEKHAGDPQ